MRDPKEEGEDFAAFLRTLSPEQIAEGNRRDAEQAEADHRAFSSAFKRGQCSLCGCPLSHFDRQRPGPHWLLRPVGFTKADFPTLTNEYGLFQLSAYLRWVANEEARAQNVNDLADEGTGKLIELTIRFREYDWSFSCAKSDFEGHQTASPFSQKPHYHFQMRVKTAAFIRYNDFHVQLSRMDIINLTAMQLEPMYKYRVLGGESMSDILNDEMVDVLVRHGTSTTDEAKAPLKLDTMIMADEGTAISGEELHALTQEARGKGVTVASLAHRLTNARVITMVSPGEGVVEQAPRKGGGGRKGRLE